MNGVLPGIELGRELPPPPPAVDWSRQKARAVEALRTFHEQLQEITAGLRASIGAEWMLEELAGGRLAVRPFKLELLVGRADDTSALVPDLFPAGARESTRAGVARLLAVVQYCFLRESYLAATRENLAELCGLRLGTLDWWLRRLRAFGVLRVAPVFRVNGGDAAYKHTQRANLYAPDLFLWGAMQAARAPDWSPRRRPAAVVTAAPAAASCGEHLGAISGRNAERISGNRRVAIGSALPMGEKCSAASRGQSDAPTAVSVIVEELLERAPATATKAAVEVGSAERPRTVEAPSRRGAGRIRVTDGKSFAASVASSVASPETQRARPFFATIPEALRDLMARLGADEAPAAPRVDPARDAWDRAARHLVLERSSRLVDLGALPEALRGELEELWKFGELPTRAADLLCERLELRPARVRVVCPACQFAPDGPKGCRKCGGAGELGAEELGPPAPAGKGKRRRRRNE